MIKHRDGRPDAEIMKSCPGCNFLIDDDAESCRYCGADSTGVAHRAPLDDATPAPARHESVSTRLTAGVIVVASLAVVGVGAWAFHHSPPAPTTHSAATVPSAVSFRSVTVTNGGPPYSVEVPVGTTDPALTSGVVSQYATAREFDATRLPGVVGGATDLNDLLTTFGAGWPAHHVTSTTTPMGPGLSFDLTNSDQLIVGTLIDAGTNGVFIVDLKAPPGSTLTSVDHAALRRAVATLKPAA